MNLLPIHPFPARMAPEIIFRQLAGLNPRQTILDPMSGSGTVLRASAELGHIAIGFDADPLAVLMARVWTRPLNASSLQVAAEKVVKEAKNSSTPSLPWIDGCEETKRYIEFWYCPKQIRTLRRLSYVLASRSGPIPDALRIALSRILITKERGASRARDTSHSRPHRVFFENDYDVYEGFVSSTKRLAARLHPEALHGSVAVRRGDARDLRLIRNSAVDIVITSPPYLNAIDYLRGHRLSLVWLGYSVQEIKAIRSKSIGNESGITPRINQAILDDLLRHAGAIDELNTRESGMVKRYAQDVYAFMLELSRVVKKGGRLLLVVGNSCLNGTQISNEGINVAAAKLAGFELTGKTQRNLPASNRYLPLPAIRTSLSLSLRMRTETLLNFTA